MKEFNIPISTMAKMMGMGRKTLSDIITNKREASPTMSQKIDDFVKSWTYDKELDVWTQGYISDIENYKISKTGYAYPKPKKIVKNDLPKARVKRSHKVEVITYMNKEDAEAMRFHKDKIETPVYDCWLICTKCDFRVKGKIRHRHKYKHKCGGFLRPCLNCSKYQHCENEEKCEYRKRIGVGVTCKHCGEHVSERDNELMECGCGYLNTYKDAESVAKVNEENGYN